MQRLSSVKITAKTPVRANENAQSETRYFPAADETRRSGFPGNNFPFMALPVKNFMGKVIHNRRASYSQNAELLNLRTGRFSSNIPEQWMGS
jgi:hypothetical protein